MTPNLEPYLDSDKAAIVAPFGGEEEAEALTQHLRSSHSDP
jgi:hypothetical protein